MANKPSVSIVVPAYNEASCLEKLHHELASACDLLPFEFSFVFIDDGSTDETAAVLSTLRVRDSRVCYLRLSRNFGHQAALSAGLSFANGDAVIMMDADLQHPPDLIPELLERWEDGYDVVNAVRLETACCAWHKRLFSRAFYPLFKKLSGLPIEPGTADFRLIARAPLDALNELPERQRFIRGLVPWLGFRQAIVPYHAPPRWAGEPKYTIVQNVRLALDGLTAFSLFPLRLLTAFGLVVTVASALCELGLAIGHVFGVRPVDGWTTLLISLHFFGGCQLATLGVLGEYLGRTLEEVKGRPSFIVQSAAGFAAPRRYIAETPTQACIKRSAV